MNYSFWKKTFPKPSAAFFKQVEEAIAEPDRSHSSERTKENQIELSEMYTEYKQSGKMNIPTFYKMRRKLIEYRDNRRLDYVTSPESETYWAS